MTQNRAPFWAWIVFLWFAVFSVYSPALLNEFVWDDHLSWFLACWFFHSNLLFKLNAHLAEHWMYFGYAGLAWAAANVWGAVDGLLRPVARRVILLFCLFFGLLWAGRTFARQLDWKNDLVFFQSNLRAGAHTSRSHLSMASAYARNGYIREAIPHFLVVLEKDPGNVAVAWWLARCCYQTGDYQNAIALAEKLKKQKPGQAVFDMFLKDCRKALEKKKTGVRIEE